MIFVFFLLVFLLINIKRRQVFLAFRLFLKTLVHLFCRSFLLVFFSFFPFFKYFFSIFMHALRNNDSEVISILYLCKGHHTQALHSVDSKLSVCLDKELGCEIPWARYSKASSLFPNRRKESTWCRQPLMKREQIYSFKSMSLPPKSYTAHTATHTSFIGRGRGRDFYVAKKKSGASHPGKDRFFSFRDISYACQDKLRVPEFAGEP